jgi:hypothetical protein
MSPFIGQAITQEKFDISHWMSSFIGQAITQEKFDTSHWCPPSLLLVRPLPKKSLIQVTDVPFYWSGHYPRKVWYKSLMSSFIGQTITQETFDASHWCLPFYWSDHYPRKVWYKSLMSSFIGQTITQETFDASHWCLPFYWSDHYPRKAW